MGVGLVRQQPRPARPVARMVVIQQRQQLRVITSLPRCQTHLHSGGGLVSGLNRRFLVIRKSPLWRPGFGPAPSLSGPRRSLDGPARWWRRPRATAPRPAPLPRQASRPPAPHQTFAHRCHRWASGSGVSILSAKVRTQTASPATVRRYGNANRYPPVPDDVAPMDDPAHPQEAATVPLSPITHQKSRQHEPFSTSFRAARRYLGDTL